MNLGTPLKKETAKARNAAFGISESEGEDDPLTDSNEGSQRASRVSFRAKGDKTGKEQPKNDREESSYGNEL